MIEIKDLSKHYGKVQAVRNLSLTVPRGELFCFLGPNGAGKTTTLKILTGLLKPSSGSTHIGGLCMQTDPVASKKMIGYIPDMPFLYERLTTKEFFRFSGDLYGMPGDLVESRFSELFKLFDLVDQQATLVKDLSHGMRQRLIYASTLLHDPQVLFIDEPLIGLDPRTIRLIKDLLREKARNGMTIFLTTHILALAQDIADRIGIILDGRLVALGTLRELLDANKGSTDLEQLFLELTRKG
ncbi:MAG: ABC transporter [Verrucomicrobia bacterium]|nr:ABC transporter [Verrucomicrobiota bacterium]